MKLAIISKSCLLRVQIQPRRRPGHASDLDLALFAVDGFADGAVDLDQVPGVALHIGRRPHALDVFVPVDAVAGHDEGQVVAFDDPGAVDASRADESRRPIASSAARGGREG